MKVGTDSTIGLEGSAYSFIKDKQEVVHVVEGLAAQRSQQEPPRNKPVAVSGSNMLSRNFVQQDVEKSRYVTGLLDGLKLDNQMSMSMQDIVDQYSLEASMTESYAGKSLAGMKAERAVKERGQQETAKATEEKLEDDTKKLEEEQEKKLEEERTGVTEDGQPVEEEEGVGAESEGEKIGEVRGQTEKKEEMEVAPAGSYVDKSV